MSDFHHVSVMLERCLEVLAPADGEVFVDCTLGAGGHTEAILQAANCRVIGLDQDPNALASASARLAPYADRFTPVRARFSELGSVLDGLGIERVDGILADIGVSSPQLDTAERGFSFRFDGPLDMRMDPDAPLTADEIVNTWDETELTRILREYGEERRARAVALAIVQGRPWTTTLPLAQTIASKVGKGKSRIHPATRSFQAIRIAVNDELGELERLLPVAVDRLAEGGRMAIICFHSLEDRMVKRFLSQASGRGAPRDPWGNPLVPPLLSAANKAHKPSPSDPNPRASSARLRSAVRLPWNA